MASDLQNLSPTGCGKALLENGFVVLKNASTMYYRCNEGYKLSTNLGWGVATCGDGHWNGFSGQCIGTYVVLALIALLNWNICMFFFYHS